MLRKTTAAVVLAGALALGTASATSLGTFDDVSFAAGSVELIACTIPQEDLNLVPLLPSEGTLVGDLPTGTLLLDSVDLSGLNAECSDHVADVVLVGATDVLGVVQDVDLSASTTVDVSGLSLDILDLQEVRIVVSGTSPAA